MTPHMEHLLRVLRNYQRPGSQLAGLRKKFSTDKFSSVSVCFQYDAANSKERRKSSDNKTIKAGGREAVTTDKKRTVSGEKLARPAAATLTCQKAGNNTST